MTDRERLLELWSAHLLGCLDEAETTELERRLAAGETDAEMARLEEAVLDLAAAAPPALPNADLRARVLAATAPRSWRRWAVAAGMAALLLAGWLLSSDWRERRAIDNAPHAETWTLEAKGRPDLRAEVTYDPDTHRAIVRFTNYRPKAGRDYELWVVPAGEQPRSLGVISGRREVVVRGLPDIAAFAVSEEAAGGSRTGAPETVIAVGARPQ